MAHNRFLPVFTPVGVIVLLIALFILIRSLVIRNAYEIALSSAFLLLMLVFGIIGFWKSRKLIVPEGGFEPGWKPPSPMTANAGNETLVSGLDAKLPLFFRLHYFVRGRFFPCGKKQSRPKKKLFDAVCAFSVETSVPRGKDSVQIPFDFPMSGVFLGAGFCTLRDIFGLFSFSCSLPQSRTVNVRCTPCYGKMIPIKPQAGAEDQRNKPAADIERYYMREYTPGDRLRDINWKSSEKIDALITRISTDNQEKTTRIEVHFRNYAKTGNSLEALWLLDRAKARLSYFLRSLMEQNSSFVFDVHTACGDWEITNQDELNAFCEELAGFSFFPPQNEKGVNPGAGDIYVFSTACDIGLPAFILAGNPRPITLFLAQPSQKKDEARIETETLLLGDFTSKGFSPPVQWFAQKKLNPLKIQSAGMTTKTEMFYAKTALVKSLSRKSHE